MGKVEHTVRYARKATDKEIRAFFIQLPYELIFSARKKEYYYIQIWDSKTSLERGFFEYNETAYY